MTNPVWGEIFLADVGVRSIILAALVCLSVVMFRRKSAAFRHALIWLGFVAMVFLPFASLFVTRTNVAVLPPEWVDIRPIPAPLSMTPTGISSPASRERSIQVSEGAGVSRPTSLRQSSAVVDPHSFPVTPAHPLIPAQPAPAPRKSVLAFLDVLWIAGALILVVRFCVVRLSLYRFAHRTCPLKSAAVTAVLEDVCARLCCSPKTVRLASGDAGTPLTWGWPYATIVLPLSWEEWNEGRLRSALLHEVAHVRRGDWIRQQGAELICIFYWFNPLIWTMLRRLRTESECSCDDLVLSGGIPASEYAGDLLEIARSMKGQAVPATLGMTRSSEIGRRIRAIVGNVDRRSPRPLLILSLTVATLALLAPLTAISPQPMSMNAAARRLPFKDDTLAHEDANIAYLKRIIRRYGEGDPSASDAYYLLGQQQQTAGHNEDAIASFERCLQLPEPAWSANNMTHSFALDSEFQALQSLGKYREALALMESSLKASRRTGIFPYFLAQRAQWQIQLTEQANRQDNKAAYRSQLAQLSDDSRWTRQVRDGWSIQVKGLIVTTGSVITAYSPDGRFLTRHTYLPEDGKPYVNMSTNGYTTRGFGEVNDMDIVVAVKHPKDQPVFFRFSASPETPALPYWSASGTSDSPPISNGALVTDEESVNPATGGLRVIRVSLPTQTRTIKLTCGIAAAPNDVKQIQTDASSLMQSALYDSVTFDQIVSPIPPRPGTLDHPQTDAERGDMSKEIN